MTMQEGQSFEVPEPILNPPFEKPTRYWYIREGEMPVQREGRRPAIVFPPRNQKTEWNIADNTLKPSKDFLGGYELSLVMSIRERVAEWKNQGYPGVTRTTLELLQYWQREGRQSRLIYAQLEAIETVIFVNEARPDFRQGINIPSEKIPEETLAKGDKGFRRYACKMATGAGKTNVMAMISAWSILNKVNDRMDARFSDVILVVCPNVTIRNRLRELDPAAGEASLYRIRDLVPPHLMPLLTQGRIIIHNWHIFEPQSMQAGGTGAKVIKSGVPVRTRELITIGKENTTARGKRYLTLEDYQKQIVTGQIKVIEEERDKEGNLKKARVEATYYVESDTSVVNRIIGREAGGKKNILVLNDESHHAYRIHREDNEEDDDDDDEEYDFYKEATVWVEGLDRINKLRGVNFCVDLSATPYFLGRVGKDTNRPFPWVISDFGLVEAIESGLVKIPQMAVRDTTGEAIPGYFNIWEWILKKLTAGEKGGSRGNPKPEAILKYAHHPIAMLGSLWETEFEKWRDEGVEQRPPVFIIVCKNTKIAKVIYEWLAEDVQPTGIPPAKIEGFRNTNGKVNTIRVDSKVVHDTDTGASKSDESRWMRFILDTVGKISWSSDPNGAPIYPDAFEDLAKKLGRAIHPPGRDIRCIVSVGMLTEGWDCNTVTHIVGLRPFMSQLLCEQVVGRGLRRVSYELGADGKFTEEVAKVFGVPFEVIPFKANTGAPAPKEKRFRVHAIPEKSRFEIKFPRVEGYTQAIRNKIAVNWQTIPNLTLRPDKIPPEVEMKAVSYTNKGKLSLMGPGKRDDVTLKEFREKRRLQELIFDLAGSLTREYVKQDSCTIPAHVLFPQVVAIVDRYVKEKVDPQAPADIKDLFLSPYYGWLVETLLEGIRPDTSQGEAPEVPRYEKNRDQGSTADVDFWTSKEAREVVNCHLNYAVADTKNWEQTATYYIDKNKSVDAFVKNAGLGFTIPYVYNGEAHEYIPDFIIRLKTDPPSHLILETKGFDEREQHKIDAAHRWVAAVNSDGKYGRWEYTIVKKMSETGEKIDEAVERFLK